MPMQTRVSVGWGVCLPVDEGRRLAQAIREADKARLKAYNEELGGWPPPPEIPDDRIALMDGAEFSASHVALVVERTFRRLPWGRDFANKPVDVAKMGAEPVTDLSREAMARVEMIARANGIVVDTPRWWSACSFS